MPLSHILPVSCAKPFVKVLEKVNNGFNQNNKNKSNSALPYMFLAAGGASLIGAHYNIKRKIPPTATPITLSDFFGVPPKDSDFYLPPLEVDDEVQAIRVNPKLNKLVGAHNCRANTTIEDRIIADIIETPEEKGFLGAVLDGHGGPHISNYSQRNLARYVNEVIKRKGLKNFRDTKLVQECMHEAFIALDSDICRLIRGKSSTLLFSRTAKTGACCLATIVTRDNLIVANSGDCEGVLSQSNKYINKKGKFKPIAIPHSANEADEQARLRKQHPNEPNIIRCKRENKMDIKPRGLGHKLAQMAYMSPKSQMVPSTCYVKGRLMPTRCFGDFHLKDEEFAFDHETNKLLCPPPYSFPYITAVPDLFNHKLPRKNSYLMLASDGVFDFLDYKEVHECMSQVYKKYPHNPQKIAEKLVDETLSVAAKDRGVTKKELLDAPQKMRRRMFDDTSVIVLDINKLKSLLK